MPVGRRKHLRRKAEEIDKRFQCKYPGCKKNYGSEGSLNLHVKIKHKGESKSNKTKSPTQHRLAEVNQELEH